jgi:hypothetical protein
MLAREGMCAPPSSNPTHTCAPMASVSHLEPSDASLRRGAGPGRSLLFLTSQPVSNACLFEPYGVENCNTTFNNGSLGFRIDEERRESAKRNVNCRIQ